MLIRQLLADDWRDYRNMRLESLAHHAGYFGSKLDKEQAYSEDDWKSHLTNKDCAMFGLFNDSSMIGLTGVGKMRDDESGKTAILFASYLRKDYRGRGLSRLFYEVRINWAKDQGCFERILVAHRIGNEASRRANQAFGFQYISTVDHEFGDGTIDKHLQYELRI